MVPVGGGRIRARGCFQDGCEVLNLHITVQSGACWRRHPFYNWLIFCLQSGADAASGLRLRWISIPGANIHECQGQVAVLINHVGQVVELIPTLDVVSTKPAVLE